MNRRTSVPLAAVLTAGLILVSAPGAQAAVTAKDAPSKSDITRAFPALAGGQFGTDKSKQVGAPGDSCDSLTTVRVKSAVSTTGVSSTGAEAVVAGVAELKSNAKSKAYFASYKKYVKSCSTYTEPISGATITLTLSRAPKVGQASLVAVQQTTVFGITSHSTTLLIRDGKRIGSVVATDDAPVVPAAINKLAKVTAKKMK